MAMIMGATSMGMMISTTPLSLPQPPTISFEKKASLSSVATFQCPGWRKQMVVEPDLQAKTRNCWRGIIVQASSSTVQGDRGTSTDESLDAAVKAVEFTGVHHVGLLCENTERSLEFYCGLLGLEINPNRPNDKLPYGGKWLNVGSQMIHLMELPNPDPKTGRPKHGGRDRHACVAIKDVSKLKAVFDKAGVPYTLSKSGRPAIFARDPDGNALEFVQTE
ncbi:unnamed protein product [Sphagnum balticum]